MKEIMMVLGTYLFTLDTTAYQTLKNTSHYRWEEQERIGRLPARQYVGQGSQTLDLSGVIYPAYYGNQAPIEAMRAQAGKAEPLILIDGLGYIWGKWVILNITDTSTVFFANGQAKKIEFQLQLARYGKDDST